jgi:hypothetical protein
MFRIGKPNARTRDASMTASHHASDCPAALGAVKARRFAPPALRAARGLDGALDVARIGHYVMARRALEVRSVPIPFEFI